MSKIINLDDYRKRKKKLSVCIENNNSDEYVGFGIDDQEVIALLNALDTDNALPF